MTGGISMVLLIFAVLLLVSFASLSISAARADLRLSERYATASQDYYAARNQAHDFLAELDTQLTSAAEANAHSASFTPYSPMIDTLQALSSSLSFTLTQEKDQNSWLIEKTFPSGDNAQLVLRAEVAAGDNSKASVSSNAVTITVLSEKLQTTQDFDYDSHLNVIQ